MSDSKPLSGKVVLVTGASRGIGYFAAREAARRGAHIVALARTVGGLEELDDEIRAAGGEATLVPLDLRKPDGIDALGKAIFERWGRLDGMIANAGVLGGLSPVAHVEPKEFDKTFAINVTANYRLIRSMDLLLRQSPAGRAVFVTSGAARSAPAFWGVYSATKAALEALVKSYAAELTQSKAVANVFSPGAARTAMRAQAMPGENPETLTHPRDVAPALVDMIMPTYTETRMVYDFPRKTLLPL
jgi:NAD(P)-dependent dehydrogenase (short-subunit alcohol dehydrogenase family)